MTAEELKRLRAQAREVAALIVHRVVQDPEFAAELRSDPRATLSTVDFPEALANDFIRHDMAMEPEVVGYRVADDCDSTCIVWTCLGTLGS